MRFLHQSKHKNREAEVRRSRWRQKDTEEEGRKKPRKNNKGEGKK